MQSNAAEYRNNGNRKSRRAYDRPGMTCAAGEHPRPSSAGAGSDLGYSGHAIPAATTPIVTPMSPAPAGTGAHGELRLLPGQQHHLSHRRAEQPEQRRAARSGQSGQRRTSGGNQRNRRPSGGQNRNAQRRPQNAQSRSGQRMRPVQGQNARRDPVRREGRKKRRS